LETPGYFRDAPPALDLKRAADPEVTASMHPWLDSLLKNSHSALQCLKA
jgi:hypothetical protein